MDELHPNYDTFIVLHTNYDTFVAIKNQQLTFLLLLVWKINIAPSIL